jgi:hypothetical protein
MNGFDKPYNSLQVATWVAFPVLMLQFLFFVSPILPLPASISCTLVFFACAFAAAYYGYNACIIDPMDHHLAKHLRETETGEVTVTADSKQKGLFRNFFHNNVPTPNTALPQEEEPLKYCWVCELSVAEHSMHCKYCNKCVAHFDHHCLWLNTCVGEANYEFFYNILWSTCAMLVVHFSIMLGLVVAIFTDGPTQQRADEWFSAGLSELVLGVLIFFIVFDVICISAAVQLLLFHIGLRRKGLTTYQFIVTDNARKRQDLQKKEERRSKRVVAVTKARREGHTVKAIRLQMGQYCCAPCDPLPSQEAPGDNGNGDTENTTTAYAVLEGGNDVNGVSSDEKMSSTSLRDLARTNATSLGGSSSSHNEGVEVSQQDGNEPPEDENDAKAESNNTGVHDSGLKVREGEPNVEEGEAPSDKV